MARSFVSLGDERTTWRDPDAKSVGYFAKGPLSAVDERLLAELRRAARASGDNARLSLHPSPDAAFHEMIIYQHADRIHPPKKHLHKDKSFHAIEGKLAVFVFDDAGDVIDSCVLDGKQRVMYRVAAGLYHADIPLGDHVIHHESTTGPFVRASDSQFAPWAPAEDDHAGLAAFRERLLSGMTRSAAARPHILVTGAGGFCGGRIARHLAHAGHEVAAVQRHPPESPSPRLHPIIADLRAPGGLPDSIDVVIHAAARLGVPGISAADIAADNVEATRGLIEHALGAGATRFIFLSAISMYGTVTQARVDEQTPIVNPDAYGASKLMGERMLAEAHAKIASLSLRLPSVIGAGARHGWLTGVARKLVAGEPVSFVNPRTPFNNIVHVDELTAFIERLVEAPLQGADVVTLGAAGPMPLGEVVEALKISLKSRSTVNAREVPNAPAYMIDSTRAERQYGWKSSPVRKLLDRLVEAVA